MLFDLQCDTREAQKLENSRATVIMIVQGISWREDASTCISGATFIRQSESSTH